MATDIQLTTSIETANSAKSLRELNKGLKDLIALQGQVGSGTADFKKLQDAINKTENRVGDLKDSFQTLRGSGVERANASISLFREGLLNADTEKLQIGLHGIGAAMKAIPIFLLIEGARLLFENFDKVTAYAKELTGGFTEQEKAVISLTKQANEQHLSFIQTESDLSNEITLLRAKHAPLELIYNTQTKLTEARIKDVEATIAQQEAQLNQAKQFTVWEKVFASITSQRIQLSADRKKEIDDAQKSLLESVAKLKGIQAASVEDLIKLKEQQEAERRVLAQITADNISNDLKRQLALEKERYTEAVYDARGNAALLEQELIKHKGNVNAINLEYDTKESKRRRDVAAANLESEKQQAKDILEFTDNIKNKQRIELEQKLQDKINSVESANFLLSIEQGKREADIEKAELIKSLSGRIAIIEQKKREEIAKIKEGSDAAVIIEKNASEAILQEKLKTAQKSISIAQNVSSILSSIVNLLSQNETYRIQQEGYFKDADLENSKNRTQETIDLETQRTNKLLNNESLTANQREQIKYNSETRQRQIEISAKNQQIKIQEDFDKKSLEIRKKQFEREKKIQLATAIINTAAAVVNGLLTVPFIPAGIAAGVAAAAVGAAQIAVITSKKFDDGGAAARSTVAPVANIDTRSGPSSGSAPGSGTFNTGFNPNGNATGASNTPIKVVVLESDIREVTSKVSVLESRATFG